MSNKALGIFIAIIILAGGAYLVMNSKTSAPTGTQTTQTQKTDAEGRVIFSVTDAAADMSTISEINMTVSRVEMHQSGGGWVTASTSPRTYSLLSLDAQNKAELLADVGAQAGTYDQIRLGVDSISVKTKAGVTSSAKLPSGELKINTRLIVEGGKISSVSLDFLADQSLHITGSGQYIFAPVVKIETRSGASVNIDADSSVIASGGRVDNENTVGMDIDGSIKANFRINGNQKLNIGSDNMIKIGL